MNLLKFNSILIRSFSSAFTRTSSVGRKSCKTIFKKQRTNMATLTKIMDIDTPIIPLSEAKRFIVDCMKAVDTPEDNAEIIAENLITADYRGHYSHGMNRLEMYINDVIEGTCDNKISPLVLADGPVTAWVDGRNGLGAVIGKFCMELAISKAKKLGLGLVAAKASNHYGIAGIYSLMAIKEGLIGFSCTNTSPLMTPTRGKDAAFGTNPIALGAPAGSSNPFVLDMATTAVAVGKIEFQKRKQQPLPEGWALDKSGKPTTDANVAYDAKRLMPLGGPEENSGYKGYGLAFLVDILSGVLSGATCGPNIRMWGVSNTPADLGQCFMAIDPCKFAPNFEERLCDLMEQVRAMPPADPTKPIFVAGDPESHHMASVDQCGGLRYVPDQLDTCQKLAEKLKVLPLRSRDSLCCE